MRRFHWHRGQPRGHVVCPPWRASHSAWGCPAPERQQSSPCPQQWAPQHISEPHAPASRLQGGTLHWPSQNGVALAQTMPQPPQLCGSLYVLTHCPPQQRSPMAQSVFELHPPSAPPPLPSPDAASLAPLGMVLPAQYKTPKASPAQNTRRSKRPS